MVSQAIAPENTIDTATIEGSIEYLQSNYPDLVKTDERDGYSGIIVDCDRLLDIAGVIRNDLGFDYLSSATAVDYLGEGDHMEMVYHAFRTSGGGALVFKAQTDRENPRYRRSYPYGEAQISRSVKPGTSLASNLRAIPI